MLDGRGFHSYSGIEELKDKCLITQSHYGLLEMHDLLQDMGREIVRQESPKEPGQRSRLWFHEDVRHVLEENTGTNEVEGILVNLPNRDPIGLSPKAFKKMKSLKMFINNNAYFSGEPNFLSNELRVLDWPAYPGEYFPSNFCGKKLAFLRMPFSRLKELKGVQNSQNLTILDFTGCEFLREIPDVSKIPNLQKLNLACCGNLVKIDHSVGFLDKLVCLDLFGCSNLMDFPRSLKLRSLKSLCLWECLSLKNFSKIECQMEYLEKINFTYTGVEELPSSIGCLVGVKKLYLGGCTNLMDLSDGIYQLQHLECLSLQGCSEVVEFLKKVEDNGQSMPSIVYTKESEISSEDELHQLSSPTNTSDSDDGCSWITFSKLPELEHSNYAPLESNFLKTFVCCSTLTILNLSESDIAALPSCIRKFVGLKKLYMEDCKQLQEIQGLPPNVEEVHAKGCLSLEILLEEPTKSPCFNRWDPPELVGDETVFAALQLLSLRNNVETESYYPISLRVLDLSSSRIVTLPSCIRKFVGLKMLYLNDCKKLQEIRDLPPNVEFVSAKGCLSPEIFLEDIWDTPEHVGDGTMFAALQLLSLRNSVETESYYPISLRVLDLSSSSIVTLPSCVKKFVGVKTLYLEDCKQLQEIRGLPLNVEEVHAKGCLSLEIFLEEPTKSQYLSLRVLDLSSSPIVTLPSSIRKFVGLCRLYLDNCKQLRDIRGLPPLWQVYARGCTSLEKNQFSWKCIFDY